MSGWNESAWFEIFAGLALKSTAVLAASWLAAMMLRGRSAAARHLVWTASAAALLSLPFLSVSLPTLSVPIAGALAPASGALFQTTAAVRAEAIAVQTSRRTSSPAVARTAPIHLDWRLALMLLWVAGSLAAFLQMLFVCAGMWRIRRAALPSPYRDDSTELARELGIEHEVEVLATAAGTMPMTFGFVRPAIFLPVDAAAWSEERRRIVLLHELAHVRRRDMATQLLARVALILNWWNPLAWKAWREFLKERELATDDLVLQSGACAHKYASHLLEIARSMQPAPLGWAPVAMARRSQLEGRLLAILDARVNRKAAGRASAFVAVLAGVAMVAPLAAVRAQDSSTKTVPSDVDATIRAAAAQKNHEMLDKAAAAFESLRQFETAQKLLESAAAIREQVSGAQSLDYGVGLVKLGDLERNRNLRGEAEAFYSKAAKILGERPEAAPALMYLGLAELRKKNYSQADDYFDRVLRLDPSQAGRALLLTAIVRERQENMVEAETRYKWALAAQNPDTVDASAIMDAYGRFLNQQGREAEGKELQDRAVALRKSLELETRRTLQFSPDVLRVGNGVAAPSVISKTDPEYSEEARAAKYAGTVLVTVEIGTDGIAHNIRVMRGIGLGLDDRAIAAISQWRFKPGSKDGVPVVIMANIEVNFKLL